MYLGHLDLDAPLVWTVDDALSVADCDTYAKKIREGVTEIAPIVGHDGAPEIDLPTRNNTRLMWDDTHEANALLARVEAHVPKTLSGMSLAGANPRLRLHRYDPGERHGVHWGATDFPELEKVIAPKKGRALLFQHRILHEATAVRAGTKYVLRTDVLYRPRTSAKSPSSNATSTR